MATKSHNANFSGLFTGSAESVRRQLIEAPLESVPAAAFGPVMEVAKLLSMLPNAFVESQRRELKRLKETAEEKDERVAYLQASIEQANGMRNLTELGKVRARRAAESLSAHEHIFHGFVSDLDLAPLKGLTVRLVAGEGTRSKALSAVTEADGYFKMSLGTKRKRDPKQKQEASMSDRLNDFLANVGRDRNIYSDISVEQEPVEIGAIEILKRGKLIYRDPAAVARNQGSIYREYTILDDETSTVAADWQTIGDALRQQSRTVAVDDTTSEESGTSEAESPLAAQKATRLRGAAKKKARASSKTRASKSKK